ncbi:hypothetical protein ACFCP7_27440 [Paenibacillus elgii]
MKAYIQVNKNGDFYNVNAFIAYEGFTSLGWEIIKFYDTNEIKENNPEDVVVGGIGNVRKRLEILGIKRNQGEIYKLNERLGNYGKENRTCLSNK